MGYSGFNRCWVFEVLSLLPSLLPCWKIWLFRESKGNDLKMSWFFLGTSRCQALVLLCWHHASAWWLPMEGAMGWICSLLGLDAWSQTGGGPVRPPRPSPLAAPLLYHSRHCHRSPCHTSNRWWEIASMENRIATVEWPSCRGHWGASHRSNRFELFSKTSLINQMHIYIKFSMFLGSYWKLDFGWCFYEMKEGGFWMTCQLLSVLFSLASGPAFFPPQVTDLL